MHRSLRIGGGVGVAGGGGSLSNTLSSALRSGTYEGKIAGLYDLEETLGRGHFAVVKLARHVFTGEKVAVKVIDKSKLDEVSKAHLFQEVRCMKLVQHPNVVRLYEVIDTATKLYLILELGDGGDLYDYIMRHDTGLSEQLAKEYFRQIVRAISYCHQLHVVHRDLKPENVVFFEKLGVVKLTDFGFSNKFCPGQKLETSCGSLAYSAPEILLGDSYDAPAVDVWSLGVILYMLVCGQAPFQEANDSETLTMIMDCKYSVPPHVSKDCQDLIARMLVRNPEKRATLSEIANHKWLAIDKDDIMHSQPLDALPLVSREQLSEDDHNLIVQKIVNGNIATKEEIQECLDKNEYNHITATYYLLAERKLRLKRQDHLSLNKTKQNRPEHLAVPPNSAASPLSPSSIPQRDNNNGTSIGPTAMTSCLLSVPRTPGDVPQRSRKCSIVQEDEEEEDISACSGREELVPPLNRRGSRSEGRLNLALQERLAAETERRKIHHLSGIGGDAAAAAAMVVNNQQVESSPKLPLRLAKDNNSSAKWRMGKSSSLNNDAEDDKIVKAIDVIPMTTTTIITDSSTISIPILTTNTSTISDGIMPKYKTMPASPTRTTNSLISGGGGSNPLQLNEIFEEGDGPQQLSTGQRPTSRQFVSRNHHQNRTSVASTYEQRRSKFHKARTASCSSSDASDDDSEKRKKRANKLQSASTSSSGKPFQGRRDSHDDSSDSQEPGTGGSACGGNAASSGRIVGGNTANVNNVQSNGGQQQSKNGGGNTNSTTTGGGRKNTNVMIGRRHKQSRRRSGETRLRESQSLNRITEVQEDTTTATGCGGVGVVLTSSVVETPNLVQNNKVSKGIGTRILQGLSIRKDDKLSQQQQQHLSRKDTVLKNGSEDGDDVVNNTEIITSIGNGGGVDKGSGNMKKMRLLGKYFHVHKKLCIPLPGLFSKNRLYKAQSCGSLIRDKINLTNTSTKNGSGDGGTMLRRPRACSVIRDGDINQNDNDNRKMAQRKSTVVQLNNVCNELTGICAVHLGQASKCCSFC